MTAGLQSVLPNGDVTHTRVPVDRITIKSATQCVIDHAITLTVPPFSDPTSLSVAVCVEHPALPGAVVNVRLSTLCSCLYGCGMLITHM